MARLAVLLAIVAAGTGIGMWSVAWWEERPLAQAAAALERKDHLNALKSADRYLAEHHDDLRAGILKARALSGLGRHQEADELFERLARRANGFPDDVLALRDWSTSLLHLQRWHHAITILETLLESNPSDPDLTYSLAAAQIRIKHFKPALDTVTRLREMEGYADQADVLIGTIHHDLGDRRKALTAWEAVFKRNPEAANLQIAAHEFLTQVGEEMLAVGEPRRAAQILERSIAKRPTAQSLAALGTCYLQSNRSKDADTVWRRAVSLEPLHAAARGELANAALRNGRPQDAVEWLQPLTSSSRMTSSAAYVLQRAYTKLKQPKDAALWRERTAAMRCSENIRSTLDDLMRRSTDPFWTGVLHAYERAERKDWDGAQSLVAELLKQRPNDAFALDLAHAIHQRGELPALSRLTGKQF